MLKPKIVEKLAMRIFEMVANLKIFRCKMAVFVFAFAFPR